MSRAVSIPRTVRDLKRAGLAVREVIIEPDGTKRFLTAEPATGPDDELAAARARRHARKTDRAA